MQRSIGDLDLTGELWIPLGMAVLGGLVVWLIARFAEQRWGGWARTDPAKADKIANGVVLTLIVLYILTIGGLALARHNALKSHAYDLGIFSQVLWNTSRGDLFQNTVMVEYAENLLGQHFAPIFLLMVPIYWVWPDPRALLILQTVALAIGALPLFWLAQKKTGSRTAAVLIAAAYLVTPAVHYVNFFDFHEIALVAPMLLFAIWFMETGRIRWLLVVLGLALLCREEVGFIVAAFGVVLLFKRHFIAGVACILIGLGWTAAAILYIVPHFQETADYYFVVRYGRLGNNIREILTTIVTRPGFVFEYLTTGQQAIDRAAYLVRLAVPVGGLAVFAPGIAVLAAPTLGYLLLSDYKEQYDIINQYSAPIVPILFAATAAAIGTLGRRTSATVGLAGFVFVAALVATVQYGPTPIGRRHDAEQFTMTDHARTGYSVMAQIPDGASVSAQSNFVPHLSTREEIYVFPYLHGAEYVLVDNWTDRWPLTTDQWNIARDEIVANPTYELIVEEDGYGLFHRKTPLPIQQSVSVSFLDKIELVGVDLPKEQVKPGATFEIGLYWKPLTPIGVRRTRDRFSTSVKIETMNGETITQVDKEPWDGLVTTDRMIQGEIHRERYILKAPDVPGTYNVVPGMYSFYSKRPLAIHVDGKRTDRFTRPVTTIVVAP